MNASVLEQPSVERQLQVIDVAASAEPNVSKIIARLAASARRNRDLSVSPD